ncbi:MAG: hypothetical protein VXY03_05780 [Bacteroidota bacterium]|nr:hypothetical protein [Bacteroidota bacterium]
MELKSTFLLMIGLGMASCHWFDPTDIEDAARERPHIFVHAVMGEDSTFCSISSVSSGGVNTEEEVQACVTLAGASESLGTTCESGASEAMGFWLPTSGLTMNPEQPLSLMITSDIWGDMRATSRVPAAPTWSTLHLSSRAIQEGDKVFDEFELNLTRDEDEGKWHLLQLLLQVDTVLAPPPTARNLRSDDPHVLVRKHGGPALDNALLVGNDGWVGLEWDLRFRVKNNLPQGIPHHYILVVHSISEELHAFWEDLEWARRNNGHDVRGNIEGGEGCFGLSEVRYELAFP